MFSRFQKRSHELEHLDKGDYTPEEYEGCLVELRRINAWLGDTRALSQTLLAEVEQLNLRASQFSMSARVRVNYYEPLRGGLDNRTGLVSLLGLSLMLARPERSRKNRVSFRKLVLFKPTAFSCHSQTTLLTMRSVR